MSKKHKEGALRNSYTASPDVQDGDDTPEDFDEEINIVMIGNRFVGKTSMLFKFITNNYTELYLPTIGVDHRAKIIKTYGGNKVNVKVWDTSKSYYVYSTRPPVDSRTLPFCLDDVGLP